MASDLFGMYGKRRPVALRRAAATRGGGRTARDR